MNDRAISVLFATAFVAACLSGCVFGKANPVTAARASAAPELAIVAPVIDIKTRERIA